MNWNRTFNHGYNIRSGAVIYYYGGCLLLWLYFCVGRFWLVQKQTLMQSLNNSDDKSGPGIPSVLSCLSNVPEVSVNGEKKSGAA
jgi:hypothetical protein